MGAGVTTPRLPGDQAATLRERVRDGLARPTTDALVVLAVLVSVVLLAVELTLPLDDPRLPGVALAGELLTGLFAVELLLRFWVAPRKLRFFATWWIDILAVLPFARPARLFRLLRVLRLVRAGVLLDRRLRWHAVRGRDGAHQLALIGSLATALVLVATFLLSSVEPGALHATDRALWFAVYMLLSGEPIGGEPTTVGGRFVTLGLMFGGLSFFGVFVGTVSAWMTARLSTELGMTEHDLEDVYDHVVVCGWNRSGPTLVRELFSHRDPSSTVVLVTEGERPSDLPVDVLDPQRFFHLQGDWTRTDVLRRAQIAAARQAILLTDHTIHRSDQDRDARTVLAALTIEKMAPRIYTIAEVTSEDTATHLEHAHIEEVVVGDWYAGMILGTAARNPGISRVLDEVLSHSHGNSFHTVRVPASWAGRPVHAVREELQSAHEATLISLHSGT
ncbi:MAG: NAD-binding protein, partial [Myxococcales bacterium]|nr:NAD-binding protein [Myxococcales bacterium]